MKKAVAITALVGSLAGLYVGWTILPVKEGREVRPQVLRGTTGSVNYSGYAFSFREKGSRARGAPGYSAKEAHFYHGYAGTKHFQAWSSESCLEPVSLGQEIEMGLIAVAATKDGPASPHIVWIKCLSPPTEKR